MGQKWIKLIAKIPEEKKRMHHNDHCKINFSKTYRFSSNFEMENTWLKHSGGSKCDQEISRKINRAHQIKLREM